jgi:methyl-accepting chemotaxis protein
VRNLKLSTRLALFVSFVVLIALAIGAVGLASLQSAQTATAASLRQSADLLEAVDSARRAQVASQNQVQEFKNILLRGHDAKDLERYTTSFMKRSDAVAAELASARAAFERLQLPVTLIDDAMQLHLGIFQHYSNALSQFEAGNLASSQAVDRASRGKSRPLEEKIDEIVNRAQQHARQQSETLRARAASDAMMALVGLAVLVALACIVAAWFGIRLVRSLLLDLGGEPAYARAIAARVAEGDLTVQVRLRPGDTRSILHAMQQMTGNLRSLVSEVAGGASGVADSTGQIAQGNADLSQRTEEQASTLEETASHIEELTATVGQNAERARNASQLAVSASDVARQGGQAVGDVVATMAEISAASARINDIVSVIDGIAFQTNILALNAAVEAARAGDEGRGFAVVASEVRSLAQRSAAAAREIKGLIADSAHKVDTGSRLVAAAGGTMEEIVRSVTRVSDLLGEVSLACQEQSTGIEQVNSAVAQMDHAVQQNASLVEQAAASTESMKQQAESLLDLIRRFRIRAEHAPQDVTAPVPHADAATPARHLPLHGTPRLAPQ